MEEETKKVSNEKKGFNVTALILGIFSLIICYFIPVLPFITGIIAIIFGVMGMKKEGKYLGVAGLVCSIIAIFIHIATLVGLLI